MKILHSNESLPVHCPTPTIFLAGPTDRNRLPDQQHTPWREEAIRHFKELGFNGTLYIPEPFADNFEKQVSWERECLEHASLILFWVPRDLGNDVLGLTTNVEFGRYVTSERTVYGRPEFADHVGYLDWLYRLEAKDEPVNDLRKLVEKAIERGKK